MKYEALLHPATAFSILFCTISAFGTGYSASKAAHSPDWIIPASMGALITVVWALSVTTSYADTCRQMGKGS